jgi:putative serine protease PepD
VSIQVGSGLAQFCTTCGTRLENGACPEPHALQSETNPPRLPSVSSRDEMIARTRSKRGIATTGVLGAGLVVALVVVALLWAQVGSIRGRLNTLNATEKTASVSVDHRIAAVNAAANGLASRVSALEARRNAEPNLAAIAKKVRASVFVIETDSGLGSAWALSSSGGTTTLVTNFHVVSDTWTNGGRTVRVKQHDALWSGTIAKVDIPDDLALITTPETFPVLTRARVVPQIGDSVLVVGAPLGLDETVTTGIVSALRSQDGHDYLQFSAPISPGSSGGPVVDHRGQVVGITVAKLVGDNAEGLSLAIPVAHICAGLNVC